MQVLSLWVYSLCTKEVEIILSLHPGGHLLNNDFCLTEVMEVIKSRTVIWKEKAYASVVDLIGVADVTVQIGLHTCNIVETTQRKNILVI